MSSTVFANGREVSCKTSGGKSIASFPDVCLTPPPPPAGPLPIPYPNSAFASDTTDGSKSVKIQNKEVMLKNKSYYKKSIGDEAATKTQGMNVITHQIQGKAYFISWSMNVKIEGENACRHLDMTTHNHASMPAGAPPVLNTAMMAAARISECAENVIEINRECSPWEEGRGCPEPFIERIERAEQARDAARQAAEAAGRTRPPYGPAYDRAQARVRDRYLEYTDAINRDPCRKAMRCLLVPYADMDKESPDKIKCPKQTGEHVIEKGSFNRNDHPDYRMNRAPCSFTEGPSNHLGEHGILSLDRKEFIENWRRNNPNGTWTLEQAADLGADGHIEQNPHCDRECIKQQLLQGHAAMHVNATDPISPNTAASDRSASDREIMRLARESRLDELSTPYRRTR
jgi:hypothetical protein